MSRALRIVGVVVAGLVAAHTAFASRGTPEGHAGAGTPPSVGARGPRPTVERLVLERIAVFSETGDAPLVGPKRSLALNVRPTEDPHAAGVACDRDLEGISAAERQILLDGGRRLGAIPKFHLGPKRSRRGDSWGVSGDEGHFEWDPVALGYGPVPAIIAARLSRPRSASPKP